jgi:TPR repeat protein
MTKTIALAALLLAVVFAVQSPANARAPQRSDVTQFRKGMAAFDRRDYTAAGVLLRSPAEHGNARAQAILCFLHTHGRGVPQSFAEAAFWCHRSAEQGNAEGQYLLGLLYDKGHGVPENYVQAYKWLNLAAAHTSGPKRDFSYRIRDSVAAKMSPRQVAKAQALAIAWRPLAEVRGVAVIVEPCADEICSDR